MEQNKVYDEIANWSPEKTKELMDYVRYEYDKKILDSMSGETKPDRIEHGNLDCRYTRRYEMETRADWFLTHNKIITRTIFLSYKVVMIWAIERGGETNEIKAATLIHAGGKPSHWVCYDPENNLINTINIMLEESYDMGLFETRYKEYILDKSYRNLGIPLKREKV